VTQVVGVLTARVVLVHSLLRQCRRRRRAGAGQ
jgi:hypothetical protein